MPQIPSPPSDGGYTCDVIGFSNIPTAPVRDKMPTAGAIQTPLVDSRADHSNTTRIPFYGPVVPKGMT